MVALGNDHQMAVVIGILVHYHKYIFALIEDEVFLMSFFLKVSAKETPPSFLS